MSKPLIAVILAGGAGARLWPVSREAFPKPFIKLSDGQSLIQKTLSRIVKLPNITNVLVVTNKDYYFLTKDEFDTYQNNSIQIDYLLEPFGRNTAAAIAASAIIVEKRFGKDAVMLVLPADHIINDQSSFNDAIESAWNIAEEGWLVTFGVMPNRPETGYGYIKYGKTLKSGYEVLKFIEKPDLEKALEFVKSGNYLWNSGMFCFTVNSIRLAMEKHCPEIWTGVSMALNLSDCNKFPVFIESAYFETVLDISIDNAVLEQSSQVAVVATNFEWEDVGSWDALSKLMPSDVNGNYLNSEALIIDSTNCFVQAESKVIAAIGIKNLIIIDTPDALLISERGRTQDVKNVVNSLKKMSHASVRHHRKVNRPWGTYTILGEGDGFKIKRVEVRPGASLSLQSHRFRSEHWIVVSGEALVINDDKETRVGKNESTYISAGSLHRLSNFGNSTCIIVEVQVGSYLGEDDIVRHDDIYGRIKD
jgi:mannose-1-phosphate guanylyltransferase / mannose-6-phosphate isomerase